VIAEYVTAQGHTLQAEGLGAFITHASAIGNWSDLLWGLAVMSGFVVLINRFVWRRLYKLAETKYHLE